MIRYMLIALILVTVILSGFGPTAWADSGVHWTFPDGQTYAFNFTFGTLSFIYWDSDRSSNILIHNTNTIGNFAAVDVVGLGAYPFFRLVFIGFAGSSMVFNVYGAGPNLFGLVYLGQFL